MRDGCESKRKLLDTLFEFAPDVGETTVDGDTDAEEANGGVEEVPPDGPA